MKKLQLFTIIGFIFSIADAYGRSALDVAKEITDRIDGARLSAQFNKKNEGAIDEINSILSGHKYGIDLKKRATEEERGQVHRAILTMHLHKNDMDIPQDIFKDLLYISNPAYYAHMAALAAMHIAANFAANNERVYFLSDIQLESELANKLELFSKSNSIENGFAKFLNRIHNKQKYFYAVLGEDYVSKYVVPLTGRKYNDIARPWLGEIHQILTDGGPVSRYGLIKQGFHIPVDPGNGKRNVIYASYVDEEQTFLKFVKKSTLPETSYFHFDDITMVCGSILCEDVINAYSSKMQKTKHWRKAAMKQREIQFRNVENALKKNDSLPPCELKKEFMRIPNGAYQEMVAPYFNDAKSLWNESFRLNNGLLIKHTEDIVDIADGFYQSSMGFNINGQTINGCFIQTLNVHVNMSKQEFIEALKKANLV